MHFNPPTGKNSSNPFYHPLNEMKFIEEAVTVDIEFKKDADGAAAVGSETGRRGLLIGGKKVKDKVYKLTFTNNAMMNKFMDKYENKLNEGTEELEEGTPEYRAMMKKYKGSDMEKVFKILDKEGFRMGEQSDTLVRNMLKKHKGNVKKAADQIMKDNPGMFDVNRMMMDHVELDEATVDTSHYRSDHGRSPKQTETGGWSFSDKKFGKEFYMSPNKMPYKDAKVEAQKIAKKKGFSKIYLAASYNPEFADDNVQLDEMSAKQHYNKMVAQGKVGRGGRLVTPIDRKRFPNREKEGLEGPFRSRKSGQVYYYDKKAGKYYDPLSDMYLQVSDVMENTASYDIDEYLAEEND